MLLCEAPRGALDLAAAAPGRRLRQCRAETTPGARRLMHLYGRDRGT